MDVCSTIKNLHYPASFQLKEQAQYRLFFDRLLRIQLYALQNRLSYQGSLQAPVLTQIPQRDLIKLFLDQLPFTLTTAQKKVIVQILEDVYRGRPMLRLLQGDVGSGKTIVATIVMRYLFKAQQGQSVLLAPLEVLATQHYKTLAKYLLPLGVRVELLTGSLSATKKKEIKDGLQSGKIHIIVGTHALLQEDIAFHDLKFVCIDEQHKFGVKQRAMFKRFNSPHILQMTATPIPRSLALAFFGEFDVSIIDEVPAGRIPIETKVITPKEYLTLKQRILQKIAQGQKVFIVTPLIEESNHEAMTAVKSALQEYQDTLSRLSELREGQIALLHGKMKPREKEQVMQAFKAGKCSVLVSTTVIEVGVDIPEATVMVIKNAERFGLAQLHQLRGRIGRAQLKSYCFLETPKKSGESYQRLRMMEQISDGFKLAEVDLQHRGSGEMLGTLQSGASDLPLSILSDLHFLEQVQAGALRLLEQYPGLEGLPGLQHFLQEKMGDLLA